MNKTLPPPTLIVIGCPDRDAAGALAFALADHFDASMNNLTRHFAVRNHRTPVIDAAALNQPEMLGCLETALTHTATIVVDTVEGYGWKPVLQNLAETHAPAVTHILLTDGEFNSRTAHNTAFTDILALPRATDIATQLKFSLLFLRHRRGEVARDPSVLRQLATRPRIIRQEDFVPG